MKKLLILVIMFFFVHHTFAQGEMKTRKWRKTETDSLTKAQAMFQEQYFVMALPIFEKILGNHPKELYLKYVTGICGLYRSDMHDKALEYYLQV